MPQFLSQVNLYMKVSVCIVLCLYMSTSNIELQKVKLVLRYSRGTVEDSRIRDFDTGYHFVG